MNIAAALKSEISRVARKQARQENQAHKKSSMQFRRDIASLKKRVLDLERVLKRLSKARPKAISAEIEPPDADGSVGRFSAKGLATQRKRLGLSAKEMGLLLGVSGQSVYHWEQGKSRPRASHMPAIRSAREMGKRDAAYKLSVLGT